MEDISQMGFLHAHFTDRKFILIQLAVCTHEL